MVNSIEKKNRAVLTMLLVLLCSFLSLSPPIRSLQVNQFPVCQTFYREFSSWDNYQNLVDVQNIK